MFETETRPEGPSRRGVDETHPALTAVYAPATEHIGASRVLPPGASLLLGRAPTCAFPGLFDRDAQVSRSHAKVVCTKRGVVVHDMGSRNGTYVNGAPVGQAPLDDGDLVAVGSVVLLLHRQPPPQPPPERDPELRFMSHAMAAVLEQVAQVAREPMTVMVVGETGVGKELVAQALHRRSGRPGELVAVNCAGLSDTLLTSELFGHLRGSFTGADRTRKGLIEAARGGTLFLDEIADASPSLQAALLRLLETGEYRPVGASDVKRADVRFVAAAQPAIEQRVGEGTFRLDLWTRLAQWQIDLPPLRERPEDIGLLAQHFAKEYARRRVPFSPELVVALTRRAWSGNVRELKSMVERLVVAQRSAAVLEVPPWLRDEPASQPEPTTPDRGGHRRGRTPRPEREVLVEVLQVHQGNVKTVASALGVPRKTLYRWFRALDLDPNEFRS